MRLARSERSALADLFKEVGPEAPTLCAGWTTRDLAAHVVTRERRPYASLGIVVPALAARTDSMRDRTATKPFADLVAEVRSGPQLWNLARLGRVDEVVNTLEFLVHHEDVRRARTGWQPRELPANVQDEIWQRLLGFSKIGFRSSPVGVVLRRPDGRTAMVKPGPNPVTLTGEPLELAMLAFGRDEHQVRVDGDPSDVTVFLAGRGGD